MVAVGNYLANEGYDEEYLYPLCHVTFVRSQYTEVDGNPDKGEFRKTNRARQSRNDSAYRANLFHDGPLHCSFTYQPLKRTHRQAI